MASQRTERLLVPFVNGDSSADYLSERGLDWFFRTAPTDRMFGEALYSSLQQEKVQPKRLSILYTSDTDGQSLHRVLHNLAPEANYDEHGMVKFPPGKPNLVPELQELRDVNKPEVLFIVTSKGGDTVRALKTMEAMGYRPPQIFVFGGGGSEPQVLEAARHRRRGRVLQHRLVAGDRRTRGRHRQGGDGAVRGAYNQPMNETAAETFTAMLVLAQGIDNAGATDPQRVRAALLSPRHPGRETIMPWSGIRFDGAH